MSLKDWSITAASNTSAPPNGCPEGWALSDINNTMRQVMADVRTLAANDTIASAATCDIGTKDSTFLTVSGTTTITALGTVSAGIYKFLTFSGALTLTHNGTSLILPGSANITTAAGDVGMFQSLGSGNWKCMAWQPVAGYQPVGGYQPSDAQLTTLAGMTAQQATDLASLSTFMGSTLNDATGSALFTTMGASMSLSTAGYLNLPGGLILKWGYAANPGASSNTTVTFPTQFPTGCLWASAIGNNIAVAASVSLISSSATNLVYDSAFGSTPKNASNWIAIGY